MSSASAAARVEAGNGRGRRSASARRAKHSAAPGRRPRSLHDRKRSGRAWRPTCAIDADRAALDRIAGPRARREIAAQDEQFVEAHAAIGRKRCIHPPSLANAARAGKQASEYEAASLALDRRRQAVAPGVALRRAGIALRSRAGRHLILDDHPQRLHVEGEAAADVADLAGDDRRLPPVPACGRMCVSAPAGAVSRPKRAAPVTSVFMFSSPVRGEVLAAAALKIGQETG